MEHVRAWIRDRDPVVGLVVGMGPGLAGSADKPEQSAQFVEDGSLRELQGGAGVLDTARRGIAEIVPVILDIGATVVFDLGDAAAIVIGVLQVGAVRPGDLRDVADDVVVDGGHGG